LIVDASGLVMGRLASVAVSYLLKGEDVKIVNAEKAIISGNKVSTFREYSDLMKKGTKEKGPHFPKHPERILKRTVRGMLPYKYKRGREAFSRLRVYVGVPPELAGESFEQPAGARARDVGRGRYIELGELSRKLGSNF